MVDDEWHDVRARLTEVLESLDDREFVILREPLRAAPATGLLRRKPRALPSRYVQYLRIDDRLFGECVGSTAFGGDWEVAAPDQERLRALGWQAPGDTPDQEWPVPNYRADRPRERAGVLAGMGVDALAVLGLTPAAVEQHRDR